MITQTAIVSTTSCSNGIQDGDETAIDCGGSCSSCGAAPVPTCDDGTQNQEETGIDCGGPCAVVATTIICPFGCVYVGSDGLEMCMSIRETTETIYCGKDGQIKLKSLMAFLVQKVMNVKSARVNLQYVAEK